MDLLDTTPYKSVNALEREDRLKINEIVTLYNDGNLGGSTPIRGVAYPEQQPGTTGTGTIDNPFISSDGTGGINDAINAALDSGERGAIVKLSNSEYSISSAINVNQHTFCLKGEVKAYAQDPNAEAKPTGGSVISWGADANYGILFRDNPITRIEINRVALWGPGFNIAALQSGYNYGVGNITRIDSFLMEESSFGNFKVATIVTGNGSWDCARIIGCNYVSNYIGIFLEGSQANGDYFTAPVIEGCIIADNDGYGIYNGSIALIAGSSGGNKNQMKDGIITRNQIVRNARLAGDSGISIQGLNTKITHNWFGSAGIDSAWTGDGTVRNNVDAIKLEGFDNIIQQNTFENNKSPNSYCIRLKSGTSGNLIDNNTFRGPNNGYVIVENGCDLNEIWCRGRNVPPIKVESGATKTKIIYTGTSPQIDNAGTDTSVVGLFFMNSGSNNTPEQNNYIFNRVFASPLDTSGIDLNGQTASIEMVNGEEKVKFSGTDFFKIAATSGMNGHMIKIRVLGAVGDGVGNPAGVNPAYSNNSGFDIPEGDKEFTYVANQPNDPQQFNFYPNGYFYCKQISIEIL